MFLSILSSKISTRHEQAAHELGRVERAQVLLLGRRRVLARLLALLLALLRSHLDALVDERVERVLPIARNFLLYKS